MYLLPSQLPSLGGSVSCHCPLLPSGGSRLRTVLFYSLHVGAARPAPESRTGAELLQEHKEALCGAEVGVCRELKEQLPWQLPISQAGQALAITRSPSHKTAGQLVSLASLVTQSWAGSL